jgi:hypothetical protein
MSSRGIIALLVLAALVFSGPVAMAFDGCAAMGAVCDSPCNASSCALDTRILSMAPSAVSPLYILAASHHPRNTLAGREHPPKLSPRFA